MAGCAAAGGFGKNLAGFDRTGRDFGGTRLGPVLPYLLPSVILLFKTSHSPQGAGSNGTSLPCSR